MKPFCLLPNELKPLIEDGSSISLLPAFYSHILLFLCCHHIGDNRGKLNAQRDLELAVREIYFVFSNGLALKTAQKCLNIVKAFT